MVETERERDQERRLRSETIKMIYEDDMANGWNVERTIKFILFDLSDLIGNQNIQNAIATLISEKF